MSLETYEPFLPFIPFALITIFGIVVVYLSSVYAKKTRDAFRKLSQQIGFQFHDTFNPMETLGDFRLLNHGWGKEARNLLEGKRSWVPWKIFTYTYKIGGGKSTHHYTQTVFCVELKDKDLPKFVLGPENLWHKFAKVFGLKDINFQSYPEFSKKYLLKGEIEEEVRKLFNSEKLHYFEQNIIDATLEGCGNKLIYYKTNKRYKATEILQMMDKVQRIVDVFK